MCIYAFLLHWVYSTHVSPQFSYLGYRYEEPSPVAVTISVLITIGVAFALPRRLDRASSIVLWILFTVAVAPSILMAPYTSYVDEGVAIQIGFVVGATYALVALAQSPNPRPLNFHVRPRTLWIVLAVFSLVTYSLLLFTQGLRLNFLSILDVYDVRAEFADEVRRVGALGYLVTAQANVINPLLAAVGLTRRNWPLLTTAVAAQLVLYSTTGYKHVLFAVLAWAVMALLLRAHGKMTHANLIMWGASAMVLVAAVADALISTNIATSLFSRRFILTPGLFTSVYVGFFSENPQAHLGYSVLAPFVDYPYDVPPPYLIGDWIAGDPAMSSNANLFADGFANFGFLGMIGAGAVLLVYLRLLDRAAVGLPIVLVGFVTVIPSVALSNSSILTSMLSHGLVAAWLALALMGRPTAAEQEFLPRDVTRPRSRGIVEMLGDRWRKRRRALDRPSYARSLDDMAPAAAHDSVDETSGARPA
ncbi:hypothetical protein JOD62_002025 [Microbacterium keratanolyticum]|uniref:hypothetical protein n=1 Tax=Microbacterium keratanolyticum TaxID=67574 RepID=UPI00195D09F4|nr:hypothetical protein [Microbacterium keratanolyticum]MBM7469477.1 hypothetical protein [Microbacterium keratanolyticum]